MNDRTAAFRALSHHLRNRLLCLWLIGCCFGCTSEPTDGELGRLALGLTTQSDGLTYRLTDARFTLSGPTPHELPSSDANELSVALPAGAYGLTLHDGYSLTRIDGDGARLPARIVSPNPLPVLIAPGEITRATLRFVLADGLGVTLGAGTLQVGVEVGDASLPTPGPGASMRDAAAAGEPALDEAARACRAALRISEIDYEQPSSDDGEFVELLNPGSCEAQLAGLRLELVNGTGGKVYGRYALRDGAETLAAGERMVLGDPSLLASLPATQKQLPLNGSGLQNGPDAMRLVDAAHVLDAVAYKGVVPGSSEGAPTPEDDGPRALARCPDAADRDDNARDFRPAPATPGAPNACEAAARDAGSKPAPAVQNTSATMPSSSSQR